MDKNTVIDKLSEQRDSLASMGVVSLGLFGSLARVQSNEHSDVDLVVELMKGKSNFLNIMRIKDFIESKLGQEIDLSVASAIHPIVKNNMRNDVIMI